MTHHPVTLFDQWPQITCFFLTATMHETLCYLAKNCRSETLWLWDSGCGIKVLLMLMKGTWDGGEGVGFWPHPPILASRLLGPVAHMLVRGGAGVASSARWGGGGAGAWGAPQEGGRAGLINSTHTAPSRRSESQLKQKNALNLNCSN